MKTIYFTCTLLSDVVLNSKLATEGNMATLDFIPGSNFLGIAAKHLYEKLTPEQSYEMFHSGKVKFGDARIASSKNEITYSVPFSYFQDKLHSKLGSDPFYLHHWITKENYPKGADRTPLQLQQSRTGYLSAKGSYVKEIQNKFSLKSAYDRENRTSLTGQMFGFEALPSGSVFIFSIASEDEALLDQVRSAIIETQRLGKSKTAEYGQVNIQPTAIDSEAESFEAEEDFVLVYAESNLCFLDEKGQPTFQPTAKDLGLDNGNIIWEKSQIRTYSYAPWNGTRKTTSTQRHCILKGSVFYVEGNGTGKSSDFIGHHQAEGLGKVLYNPQFLDRKENALLAALSIQEDKREKAAQKDCDRKKTPLSQFLLRRHKEDQIELATSQLVQQFVHILVPNKYKQLETVAASQWGNIRSIASRATSNNQLKRDLYDGPNSYLTHGVAFEKCWGKNGGKRLADLKEIIKDVEIQSSDDSDNKATPNLMVFLAKFAAEMAKKHKKQ